MMNYTLIRQKDGNGRFYTEVEKENVGTFSAPFKWDVLKRAFLTDESKPTVGYQHYIERLDYSARARWYQTSIVAEIIEDKGDTIIFRTESGSVYEWKANAYLVT